MLPIFINNTFLPALSVQVLFPLILLIVSPLVPETPRWLLHAGKDQS